MRAKRKKTFKFESYQNEGAQMSNELESDRAMVTVTNSESFGVDGHDRCWLLVTSTMRPPSETEPPSSTKPQ
jgi:hypothetical protein